MTEHELKTAVFNAIDSILKQSHHHPSLFPLSVSAFAQGGGILASLEIAQEVSAPTDAMVRTLSIPGAFKLRMQASTGGDDASIAGLRTWFKFLHCYTVRDEDRKPPPDERSKSGRSYEEERKPRMRVAPKYATVHA